jgi:predicted Zn-dependent protease
MSESSRIDDLRRRVEQDPGSIAFAQLAEEYRRAGRAAEAVEVARTGLRRHPGYLSARVTLGRALVELGQLEAGEAELEDVLRQAPQNPGAVRGMADLRQRRGLADGASPQADAAARERAERTIAALQGFLTAIHGSCSQRGA